MARGFNYDQFASGWKGTDLARSNLFLLSTGGPTAKRYLAKAMTIPASTVGVVDVPFMNRKLKVAGDRTYQDWTVTFMCDEEMTVYNDFLRASNAIANHSNIVGDQNWMGYSSLYQVQLLGKSAASTFPYVHCINAWPSEIGSLDLSWDTADTVLEFTVTFAVNWSTSTVVDPPKLK